MGRMESLQQRTEELDRKEQQLKESLLKFDKFLKENDAKRARAIKKSAEEQQLCKKKESEVLKLEELQQKLIEEREKLNEKLKKHEIYQNFMQKVLDASEEFSEVREIIDRYNTLVATHSDLLDREQLNQKASEDEKARQLFIVGSKQFFRSFDPFLLYLTFSILKQKLSARVGTAIESEKTKCLDVFTLGIAQSDCLFFHSSTYLKKKPSIC